MTGARTTQSLAYCAGLFLFIFLMPRAQSISHAPEPPRHRRIVAAAARRQGTSPLTARLPARARCADFRDVPGSGRRYQPSDLSRMSTIAELNDVFRRTGAGGTVVVTTGIAALPAEAQGRILSRVASFAAFTENNDPYGEHDFGSFDFGEQTIFWKIDCYDRNLRYASPDPANPAVTTRVLTIMLAEEY